MTRFLEVLLVMLITAIYVIAPYRGIFIANELKNEKLACVYVFIHIAITIALSVFFMNYLEL